MKSQVKLTPLKVLLLVFLLTLAIRLLFIIETCEIPSIRTPTPGLDIDVHWQAARLLRQGASMDEPCFELMIPSTPFHQYWLAMWQMIFGESLLVHRAFNALLASLSASLIFLLVLKLVPSRLIAFICAVLWAGLPSLIYFDSTLHKSVLEILVLTTLLYLILIPSGPRSAKYFFLKGLFAGLLLSILLLLQGNTFLYCIVIFSYMAADNRILKKQRVQMLAVTVPIFFITLLSFQFRNTIWHNKYPWFIPKKGIHFNIGFHKDAHGAYRQLPGIDPWPYAHVFQAKLYAETQTKKVMTPDEVDQYFLAQGLHFIKSNPGQAIRLVLTKFRLFFNNYEVKGIDDLYYLKQQTAVLGYNPLGLGILVMLAGLGIIRLASLKEYRLLFLLAGLLTCMLVANILGFVTWRYRLHNVVPLILLAAYGLQHLKDQSSKLKMLQKPLVHRLFKFCLVVILPLLVCGLVAYQPVLEKNRQGFFNKASQNDHLSQRAEKLIKQLKSFEEPSILAPDHKIHKAMILSRLHRHSESFRLLKEIHAEHNYQLNATYKYLVYLLWLGEYDHARQLMQDVAMRNPILALQVETALKGVEKEAYRIFVKPLVR